MLIVLPPSETKSFGGSPEPMSMDALSFPSLNPIRLELVDSLMRLCRSGNEPEAQSVLGISEALASEIKENRALRNGPTAPAIERYTGVLYDALHAALLTDHARSRLAIGSALFGVVGAEDPIPHYRLSGGVKLDDRTLKSRWGSAITETLAEVAEQELVVDLRSGTYQQLGRLKDAVTVRVESVQEDGSRKVISHFNKHYKGVLARDLAEAEENPRTIDELKALAESVGHEVEYSSKKAQELVLVIRN
ncbi:peroxide stress protein YaaA [Corynebacterium sp. zg254]|uniref:Peroxide stress protein YaaA n=1 Tax=Corynebacterium zhongnanshanii TaxID=2768834 RepID=A0ABQ6VGG5_9CORY|nr:MULTISPECIES: peroxide stress protein YaaA [Corynebacterium]KAB3523355.1 peroxide stress protein YaaA [Corynebacterium zhongnanshanii]MCR5913522.1 peroxide stress protein YaaA [Corynebacterium sp. zg254]